MKLIITGITGRMGGEVAHLALTQSDVALTGATLRNPSLIGQDVGQILKAQPMGVAATHLSETDFSAAEVVIDFTLPEALPEIVEKCVAARCALVTGTTGLSAEQQAALEVAAKQIPILQSFNMSLGVNVLAAAVEKAAKALDEDYRIEISEVHHQHKKDAPSGTAKLLGKVAVEARDMDWDEENNPIHFSSERIGEVIGDHTVTFESEVDRLEFTHHAKNRGIFAAGALKAAQWLKDKPAGLYSMRDVLGV